MSPSLVENLMTGHAALDDQQLELDNAVRHFLDRHEEGLGHEAIESLLGFLKCHVVEHFRTQEKMMDWADYPERAIHKAFHDRFEDELFAYTVEIEQTSPTPGLLNLLAETLQDWMRRHVGMEDVRFSRFLKT